MTELAKIKIAMEQQAYEDIRKILVEDFISNPRDFITKHGCRPEDMTGVKLRTIYRELHRLPSFTDRSKLYVEKFISGGFFPAIELVA